MSVDIHDVITNTTFCDDRLRGLGWQGVEVPISPLTGVVALYILALPCECVITDKKSQIPNPSVSLSVTLKVENLFFSGGSEYVYHLSYLTDSDIKLKLHVEQERL